MVFSKKYALLDQKFIKKILKLGQHRHFCIVQDPQKFNITLLVHVGIFQNISSKHNIRGNQEKSFHHEHNFTVIVLYT